MPEVVGIRFKKACKIYHFDPNGLELKEDEEVLVQTSRGIGYGWVALPNSCVEESELVSPLRNVIRRATDEDRRKVRENEARAEEAREVCQRKSEWHNLEMQVIGAEYAFDRSQLTFFFTADGRVDFRELVRDLAGTFHTRIELRQVGVRDEAKIIGGIGSCGRACCCASFLSGFTPITIRMAKRQNLSLNPAKISGLCGRLMCCLQYEEETYEAARDILPNPGTRVQTADGPGTVVRCDSLSQQVQVKFGGGDVVTFPVEEIETGRQSGKRGKA